MKDTILDCSENLQSCICKQHLYVKNNDTFLLLFLPEALCVTSHKTTVKLYDEFRLSLVNGNQ